MIHNALVITHTDQGYHLTKTAFQISQNPMKYHALLVFVFSLLTHNT